MKFLLDTDHISILCDGGETMMSTVAIPVTISSEARAFIDQAVSRST